MILSLYSDGDDGASNSGSTLTSIILKSVYEAFRNLHNLEVHLALQDHQ